MKTGERKREKERGRRRDRERERETDVTWVDGCLALAVKSEQTHVSQPIPLSAYITLWLMQIGATCCLCVCWVEAAGDLHKDWFLCMATHAFGTCTSGDQIVSGQ